MQRHKGLVLALLVVCLCAPLHGVVQQNKPNIVVLLMDNL
jgi:hypothetical protein